MKKKINAPSDLWTTWLDQLSFLRFIPNDQLRLHVGFGYYLGAPIESDIWRESRARKNSSKDLRNNLINEYKELTKNIPESYMISEKDKIAPLICTEYITNTGNKKNICIDILRMQVDVTNLFKLGLLEEAKTILEIGGGYGQLAAGILHAKKNLVYVIVDFPDILNIVNRWVSHAHSEIPIHSFLEETNKSIDSLNPGLNLISNANWKKLNIKPELIININSFCEMTEDQIIDYIKSPIFNDAYFYSNNRDKQFQNDEILSLTNILKKNGFLWPSPNEYEKCIDRYVKKKIYVYTKKKTKKLSTSLQLEDLVGIWGREMPAMT